MPETRARDLANLAGAGATSSTVAYHETARSFTLPAGVGEANQVISSDGDGTTQWKTTLSAPEITSVTSDKGVNAYDSDGDDGAVIVVNGTNLGSDASALTVEISTDNFVTQVSTSTISILASGTQIQATFNGTETNYNTINAGETVKVKVTKSALQSAQSVTLSGTVTGDPTFSTTSTTASTHTGTLAATSLGSYGGQIAGGGQDSNTKLLLNFDRTGGTDIEDSSNTGGEGHASYANGHAAIKSSPFGDGKSAMYFGGSGNKLVIADHDDFTIGTNDFTLEFWINLSSVQNWKLIAGLGMPENSSDTALTLGTDSGGNIEVEWNDSGSSEHILEGYQADRWYHIAISRQTSGGTTTNKAFIDGVGKDITIPATLNNPTGGMNFGSGSGDYTGHFVGYLDEIRFVNGTGAYRDNFNVPTSRFSASDEANTKLLIHSDRHGALSPETGDRRNYISVTDVGPLKRTTSTGTASQLIDGNTTATGSDTYWFENNLTSGHLLFDFKNSAIVNKFTWIQAASTSQGQWTFSGSNDTQNTPPADSSFTALKSTFDLVSGASTDHTFTNTTAYRYYKLEKTGTGTTSHGPYTHEIQFFNTADLSTAFNDSSPTTGGRSQHTITATGSYHSQGHGGIAPAMTFPASLKKTGSAGMYFDGDADGLKIFNTPHVSTNVHTIDFWLWYSSTQNGGSESVTLNSVTKTVQSVILDLRKNHNGNSSIWIYVDDSNQIGVAKATEDYFLPSASASALTLNTWQHICVVRKSGNEWELYIDGVRKLNADYPVDLSQNSTGSTDGSTYFWLGSKHGANTSELTGYIDSFRYIFSDETASGGSLYHDSPNTITVPTQIYGAYKSQDVGTIQLNASTDPSTTIDYAELDNGSGGLQSGQTALSTYGLSLSSSGAITGTLTGIADNTNTGNDIRIRARANADDNRVTTLGGNTNFTGIHQNDNTAPVLFNARRYIGTSAVRDINGFGFQPDLVWFKTRSQSYHHALFDSVRGGYGFLESDRNVAENSNNTNTLNAYNADGFELGTDGTWYLNKTDEKYIAWAWKAGGAPSADGKKMVDGVESDLVSGTNTNADDYGVEQSYTTPFRNVRQSINTAGGFNITKFRLGDITNTSGEFAWFKHGLGSNPATDDPDFVILKNMSQAQDWFVWHSGTGAWSSADGGGKLNLSDDFTGANVGQHFKKSASTGMGDALGDGKVWIDQRTIFAASVDEDFICYTWKATAGVSAFGTYTGGTSISETTNFEPKLIIIKNISSGEDWVMLDAFRGFKSTSLPNPPALFPSDPTSEITGSASNYYHITTSSSGFTVGDSGDVPNGINDGSSSTNYIYMAFA